MASDDDSTLVGFHESAIQDQLINCMYELAFQVCERCG